jgi:Double zinc ribbon
MICTFCGTENLPMNRFCGMCGVRLERRKAERRVSQSGSTKCAGCGHVNEPGYKFCGMCGVRIDRRTQDRRGATGKSRATAANAELPGPYSRVNSQREAARPVARTPVLEPEPVYSGPVPDEERRVVSTSVNGPSFLGLNETEGEGTYLLEDERSSGRGLRALILMVILAAIVGLIFVQWKSSLRANPKPLEQPKPEPASVPPAGRNHPPQVLTPGTVVGAHALQAAVAELARNAASATAAKNSDAVADNHEKLARKTAPAKHVADDPPEESSDPPATAKGQPSVALVKAQKYLQGKGVPQSCEQGLIYLKAATQENDPRAAVQMGALYSSGFCVQQDRVRAYQWFSSARDMDPSNRWINKNLSQLWAQMTPGERHRIR